eukprot:5949155-Prymnesium_polylepis.2
MLHAQRPLTWCPLSSRRYLRATTTRLPTTTRGDLRGYVLSQKRKSLRSAEGRDSGRRTSRPSGSGSIVRSALRASSGLRSPFPKSSELFVLELQSSWTKGYMYGPYGAKHWGSLPTP